MPQINFTTLPGIPLVKDGDDLVEIILAAAAQADLTFADGDIIVIAQKIVSKAEGRLIRLADVTPSAAAVALAKATEKDPALVQLILDESSVVMRSKPGVIIVRHRLGHVGANAGIDQSNIETEEGECALLLPVDPDASAKMLQQGLQAACGVQLGVLIGDSLNRPWRLGTTGGAIGCAGFQVLDDQRGGQDMFGRELKVTMINRADSIAAMATLAMGETDEGTPVAIVRGYAPDADGSSAADIMRPLEEDLFQ
jgi:coenzyme F420-0:L-glutamate ligase / coenzyme F420-1:gamma-L-glutamate ligase